MLTRKSVVLAKIETEYGVDPVPTAAANALLVTNPEIEPAGETLKREYVRSTLSPLRFLRGSKQYEVTFETELKGTGLRGALPAFGWEGCLFRACGMSEIINAGVSLVYQPVSNGFESVTLYVFKDGIFHKVTGAVGSFKINLESGKFGKIAWKFSGLYHSPVDLDPDTQTFSDVEPPVVMGTNITVDGYLPCMEKLEIDLNNTITPRKCMSAVGGIAGFRVTGRDPGGSFDPEAVLEAEENFWGKWEAATAFALAVGPLGSEEGNIIEIDAPQIQYREIKYQDKNGIQAYQIPYGLAMNTGDDELVITFT